jgi:GNAT superfamily N-acetyltransferase
MIEITRNVWEGNDYVPVAWDRWLDDPSGLLMVATVDERPVGFQHVGMLPDGSAWLEGIRVDEEARQLGVGQALLERGVEWAEMMGCPVARLSTSSENPASNGLAEKGGFHVVATFQPLLARAELAQRHTEPVRLAAPWDAPPIEQYLAAAFDWPEGSVFMTEGWTAYRVTADRLHALLGGHGVAVVGDGQLNAVAMTTCVVPFTTLRLGFLAGSDDGVRALYRWLRQQAARGGQNSVQATLPVGPLIDLAHQEGFESAYAFQMLLHERRLGLTSES